MPSERSDPLIGSYGDTLADLKRCAVWGRVGDDDLDTYTAIYTDRPFEVEDIDPFLIRADFTTLGGLHLDGSVSINPSWDDVYLIEVFVGESQFGFNWQCQEWAREEIAKLADALKVEESSIFPVQFTTPVIGPDGHSLFSGTFTPFVDIEQHWNDMTKRGIEKLNRTRGDTVR